MRPMSSDHMHLTVFEYFEAVVRKNVIFFIESTEKVKSVSLLKEISIIY